jgi:hypothetical protein
LFDQQSMREKRKMARKNNNKIIEECGVRSEE